MLLASWWNPPTQFKIKGISGRHRVNKFVCTILKKNSLKIRFTFNGTLFFSTYKICSPLKKGEITHLMISKIWLWDERKMSVQGQILSHWTGRLCYLRQCWQYMPLHSSSSFISEITSWAHQGKCVLGRSLHFPLFLSSALGRWLLQKGVLVTNMLDQKHFFWHLI